MIVGSSSLLIRTSFLLLCTIIFFHCSDLLVVFVEHLEHVVDCHLILQIAIAHNLRSRRILQKVQIRGIVTFSKQVFFCSLNFDFDVFWIHDFFTVSPVSSTFFAFRRYLVLIQLAEKYLIGLNLANAVFLLKSILVFNFAATE